MSQRGNQSPLAVRAPGDLVEDVAGGRGCAVANVPSHQFHSPTTNSDKINHSDHQGQINDHDLKSDQIARSRTDGNRNWRFVIPPPLPPRDPPKGGKCLPGGGGSKTPPTRGGGGLRWGMLQNKGFAHFPRRRGGCSKTSPPSRGGGVLQIKGCSASTENSAKHNEL